jgi:hypothetical protein
VTLTENSRQEAVQGEPVRRHVAEVAVRHGHRKPAYGLFVAPRIDLNTAETFGRGNCILKGRRIPIKIVPLNFEQFTVLFGNGHWPNYQPRRVKRFLDSALARRAAGTAWMTDIEGLIVSRRAETNEQGIELE